MDSIRWIAPALVAGVALVSVSALAAQTAKPASAAPTAKPAASDLAVTVTYAGAGTVDPAHKLLVFLFDNPAINAGSRPLTFLTIDKNGGTITFRNITANPVYVAVVYDEKGNYDGFSGPPPVGTPMGYYMTKGATEPSPVKPGEKIKVTVDGKTRFK